MTNIDIYSYIVLLTIYEYSTTKGKQYQMISTIQSNPTLSPIISNHLADQMPIAGSMGEKTVVFVPTNSEVQELSARTELAPKSTLKDKVISFVNSASDFIKGLFSSGKETKSSPVVQAPQSMTMAEMGKIALKDSLNGFSQLNRLSGLNGASLQQQHTELATGNGALRSTATALQAIKQFATPELSQVATKLLATEVIGHSFQQWATTGGTVSTFVQSASTEKMHAASEELKLLSAQVGELKEAISSYFEQETQKQSSSEHSVRTIAVSSETDNDLGIRSGSAKDNSKKTALDSVSYLSTRVTANLTPSLSSETINKLQDALSEGNISFKFIQNIALNKGDLSLVRELALSTVPKQEKNYSGHLGLIVDSLSHKRPNVSATMQGLQGFIDTSALQWHEKTAKKPEDALDANAHARFDGDLMSSALDQMSKSDLKATLTQLEGAFGQRLRGVFGLVAEKVPSSDLAQGDNVLISTAMRFSGLVEGLMTALSEKLGEATDVRFKDCDFVSELSELTAIEKAALIKVGIKEEMLL
ncbi:ADP-ribosyltransferase [Vibrio splendidus]|uniref:ADP-ribosyltransferase n=1 Tax=Vibrio splendidus TaxID=29497 RepID=A0AB35N5Z9_VIBSP|nr:ADP-ribosyltransferase [Vibrio splendidus]MDP2503850.1 ADP-ribosyltransferase [Vibrio splendidus]